MIKDNVLIKSGQNRDKIRISGHGPLVIAQSSKKNSHHFHEITYHELVVTKKTVRMYIT